MDVSRDVVVNGKKAWLRKQTGRVTDIRQWQETWVTGNAYTGYTQHRADKQKFWVVADDFEQEVFFNIQVREGHVFSLVYGGYEGKRGPLIYLYNHSLDKGSIDIDCWDQVWKYKPFLSTFYFLAKVGFFILLIFQLILIFNDRSGESIIYGFFALLLSLLLLLLIRRPLREVEKFWEKMIDEAINFAKER